MNPSLYATQSFVTDPGKHAHVWESVEPSIARMKSAIYPLVFHYRGDGAFEDHGFDDARAAEVNTRYVEDMLERIDELGAISPGVDRPANCRLIGCCRDWEVLLVSLARSKGIPARVRVGFAAYFMEGWWIDHTIAEIWDEAEQRWRLVDAELGDPAGDGDLDPLDIPRDRFLPGLDAWRRARAGEERAETFVIHPDIQEPSLRGEPYLAHNVVQDLAALNKHEMLLWDVWGMDAEPVNDEGRALLDRVASSAPADWADLFTLPELKVPKRVDQFSPLDPDAHECIDLRITD